MNHVWELVRIAFPTRKADTQPFIEAFNNHFHLTERLLRSTTDSTHRTVYFAIKCQK